MPKKMSYKDRFDQKWMPEPFSGCWIWHGGRYVNGYGEMKFNGKITGAHRVSWILHRGEIPDGLHILHKCDTPSCVNPDHLWLGTRSDNSRDCVAKNRCTRLGYGPPGEKNGCAKLSKEQAILIRQSKAPLKELSQQFGIRESTISRIRNGKLWKHL